jgi:hypothetical protein
VERDWSDLTFAFKCTCKVIKLECLKSHLLVWSYTIFEDKINILFFIFLFCFSFFVCYFGIFFGFSFFFFCLFPSTSYSLSLNISAYYISVYELGRLRILFFDSSFIPLLDLKPLHVSAVAWFSHHQVVIKLKNLLRRFFSHLYKILL